MSAVKITPVSDLKKDVPSIARELEAILERIRQRAYDLFSGRGFADGHAMEDWLAAERELCGPACELSEQDDSYRLIVTLPGFEPADVSVTATAQELVVHASRRRSTTESREAPACVCWSELSTEDALRKVALEKPIDVKSLAANLKNGLLTVTARKAPTVSHTIAVSAAA